MKRPINDEIHLGQTVDPVNNTQKVKSVDYSSDFNDVTEKMTKLQRLLKDRIIDQYLPKYLPGMPPLAYQGMIYTVKTKKPADSTHKDLQTLEFNIKLPANQYMNWNSLHTCFPIQILKKITGCE